jgi:MerR family transcriptional regulator, light-induced transcriptional regulator
MVELRGRYVDALVAGDLALAERLIEDAGTDVRTLYLQVLQPALYEIGRRWQEAEISVAQEHLATATTQSLMARLAGRLDSRGPRRDKRVLVACAEGELHSIGVRMVADFLEADGWEVLQLGASTPAPDLAQLVDLERPELVALSTTTAGSLPGVAEVLERLATVRPRPLVVVGGQMWTEEMRRAANELGADLVARDPRALVATLRARVPPPRD